MVGSVVGTAGWLLVAYAAWRGRVTALSRVAVLVAAVTLGAGFWTPLAPVTVAAWAG